LEQENQDLGKKLSEKEEEISCLTILNQRLLEQIKGLKEKAENRDTKKVEQSENEELARLKNHNQSLLMQIKKLKDDKKSLERKLEQLIRKEASKSSEVKIQVVEKGTNTDPIHITAKEDAKSVEEKTYTDVGVQTMETPSILTNRSSSINNATSVHEENKTLKVNQENATSTIRESHATKTPYRHPNHKRRHFNQSKYQHRSEGKQLTYRPKNVDASTLENKLFWESYKRNIPQRINLGWSDPFTVQQLCSTLRSLYRLVSSTITISETKNRAKTLQAKAKT
jgi:hypothetical protein